MSEEVVSNIRVNIDANKANAQLAQLQSRITAFNATVNSGNIAVAESQALLNRNFQNGLNATGLFQAKMVPVVSTMDRFSASLEKGQMSLGQYSRNIMSQMPAMSQVFKKEFDMMEQVATDRVRKMQSQFVSLGNSASGVSQAMQITPNKAIASNAASMELAIQKNQIFNKLIDDGSTKLLNWGKNTQWAGRQLMVGFSLPLAAAGALAAKTFMDLEKEMVSFQKVYGDFSTTNDQTAAMSEEVKNLAVNMTKYGFAIKDTVDLASKSAAAGAMGPKLIAQTTEATRLATLGDIDQAKALQTVISLQSAFQISTQDLSKTVDFMNAVENQTVLSLDDITTAIPTVATVIHGLGGDVQDLAVFLTAMKEGGVNAAQGANALKSGLASLENPTNKAATALKNYGIDIKGLTEAHKGDLMGTVKALATELDKLSSTDRQKALENLFGKFQYARMGALFENINRGGSQAQRAMELAGMSTQQLATMANTELGKVENALNVKFTGALERAKVSIAPIGAIFLQAFIPILDGVTNVANAFSNLPGPIKSGIAIAVGAIAGLGPVIVMTLGLLGNGIANSIKLIQFFRKGIAGLRGDSASFAYLSEAEQAARAATNALHGSVVDLTGGFRSQQIVLRELIAEYGRYAAAAGIASEVSLLGGVKRKKMATGGVVPGTGSGDHIPALLEPGETVVTKKASGKYGAIIAAMNAGTLQGFADGLDPLVFAHGQDKTKLTPAQMASLQALYPNNQRIASATSMSGLSNYGFMMPTSFNQGKMSGQDASKYFSDPKMVEQTMAPVYKALAAGMNRKLPDIMADKGLKEQVTAYAERISKRLAAEGDKAIGDAKFYDITAAADAATKRTKGYTSNDPSARALMEAVGQSRNVTTIDTFGGTNRPEGDRNPISTKAQTAVFGKTGGTSYRNKGWLSGMRAAFGIPSPAEAAQAAGIDAKVAAEAYAQGAAKATQSASPSKKGKQAAKNVADGILAGAEENRGTAVKAGEILGTSTMQGVNETANSTKSKRNVVRTGNVGVDDYNVAGRMGGGGASTFTKLLSAASAASLGLSFMGGAAGDFANKVFIATSALDALSIVMDIVKTKQAAAVGMQVAGDAASAGGSVAGGVLGVVGKIPQVAIVLTAVAAAAALVVGGIYLYNKAQEEATKRVNALASAATLSDEALSSLSQSLGYSYQARTPLASTATTSEGQNAAITAQEKIKEQVPEIQAKINDLKAASIGEAKLEMQAYLNQMVASGAPRDVALAFVEQIASEAGKREIFVKVKLDLESSMDKDGKITNVSKLATAPSRAISEDLEATRQQLADLKTQLSAMRSGTGAAVGGTGIRSDANANLKEQGALVEKIRSQLGGLAAASKSTFEVLTTAYSSGKITLAEYNAGISETQKSYADLAATNPEAGMAAVRAEIEKTNPAFKDSIAKITDVNSLMAILNAKAAGMNDVDLGNLIRQLSAAGNAGGELANKLTAAALEKARLLGELAANKEELGALDAKQQAALESSADETGTAAGTAAKSAIQKELDGITIKEIAIDRTVPAKLRAEMQKVLGTTTVTIDGLSIDVQNMADAQYAVTMIGESIENINLRIQEWQDKITKLNRAESILKDQQTAINHQIQLLNNAIAEINEKYAKLTEPLQKQLDIHQHTLTALEHERDLAVRAIEDQISAIENKQLIEQHAADIQIRALDAQIKLNDAKKQIFADQIAAIDKQVAALNEVAKVNDIIARQQKNQLDLASALSSGDIGAAAGIMQQGQQQSASDALSLQGSGLEAQKTGLGTQSAELDKQNVALNAQKDAIQASLDLYAQQLKDLADQKQMIIDTYDIRTMAEQQFIADQQAQIANFNFLRDSETVFYQDKINTYQPALRDLDQQIFDIESQIKLIQDSQIQPLTDQVDLLNRRKAVLDDIMGDVNTTIEREKAQLDQRKAFLEQENTIAGIQAAAAEAAKAASITQAGLTDAEIKRQKELRDIIKQQTEALKGLVDVSQDPKNQELRLGMIRATPQAKYAGGPIHFATGNLVPGTGGQDSVGAMLTPGEFVIRRAMVEKYGLPMLQEINAGSFDPAGGTVTPDSNVLTSAWKAIKDAAKAALSDLNDMIQAGNDKIHDAQKASWTVISDEFKAILDGMLASAQANNASLSANSLSTWSTISSVLTSVWTGMHAGSSSMLAKVAANFADSWTSIAGNTKIFVDSMGTHWDGLKKKASEPVKFVINTVFQSLMDDINGAIKFFDPKAATAPWTKVADSFSTGGFTGPGDKYQPAGIVHANEFVIKKESTNEINRQYPGMLDWINKHGSLPPMDLGEYADGGQVTDKMTAAKGKAEALFAQLPVNGLTDLLKAASPVLLSKATAYLNNLTPAEAAAQMLTSGAHAGGHLMPFAGRFPITQGSHEGGSIDYGTPVGTPLQAVVDGVVKAANMWEYSYGHHLRIAGDDGSNQLYAHMANLAVKVGQKVVAGQMIGTSGNTGNSTGPHLHYFDVFGNNGWANGGKVDIPVFDQGGFLKPGLNTVMNNTGGMELVQPRYNLSGGYDRTGNINNNVGGDNDARVYNEYKISVSVGGSNASADEIANVVLNKIKTTNDSQIRGNRVYK